MKIYHYTSLDSWPGIKHGSWKSRDEPGLGPHLRVCKDNFEDEGARDGAVFGLLEPEPLSWKDNTDFPDVWRSLMLNVGRLLLAYEASDELVDSSYIIDWSHMEQMLGGHKEDFGKKREKQITREDRRSAEKLYWGSRIPLADYIENPGVLSGVALPEVITMCRVPFDYIEIADTQPRLNDAPPLIQRDLTSLISHNPELEALSSYPIPKPTPLPRR